MASTWERGKHELSGRRGIRMRAGEGVGKIKKQRKGGQRQQQQPERKKEEAAKTVDVVLSSSFCRLVLSPTPKYTITSHWAWETSPNQHSLSVSRLCPLLLTAEMFIITKTSLQCNTTTRSLSLQTEKHSHAMGTKWILKKCNYSSENVIMKPAYSLQKPCWDQVKAYFFSLFFWDCWQYSSLSLWLLKLTWYIFPSKILNKLALHETRPQNQTIISFSLPLSMCSGWKQSHVLEIFEAILTTTVDGKREKTERKQNKNTLLWQPQTCFIHMNVSFTETTLREINNFKLSMV